MKYLNKFFFLAGVWFIGVLVHEWLHYLDCGGEFLAGVWWHGELMVGTTWCTRELKWGEWPPSILEGLIDLYGLWKVRKI